MNSERSAKFVFTQCLFEMKHENKTTLSTAKSVVRESLDYPANQGNESLQTRAQNSDTGARLVNANSSAAEIHISTYRKLMRPFNSIQVNR